MESTPSPVYLEQDYRPAAAPAASGRFVPGTTVEIVRPLRQRQPPAHVLFDFDGTLSLVREGWMDVMVPMMVSALQATGSGESPESLGVMVREFVMELNGKQTIYQMIRLAEEVGRRGGTPLAPLAYKQIYHDRLMTRIEGRREALRSGRTSPRDSMVPHATELLDELARRGAALYLASGTDEHYVRDEVRLLGLERYFGRRVYGAQDDVKAFSKAMVIQRIFQQNRVDGAALVGFGDGFVEIQNVAAAGGIAVAVASDEVARSGKPDAWKRDRLIGAGAHLVVPDYQDWRAIVGYLWNEA
jgi:phosphoglycolate phosphatase